MGPVSLQTVKLEPRDVQADSVLPGWGLGQFHSKWAVVSLCAEDAAGLGQGRQVSVKGQTILRLC